MGDENRNIVVTEPPKFDTKKAGMKAVKSRSAANMEAIYQHIKKVGGATCDECEAALNMLHATCSSRITVLLHKNLIRDTGTRRETRTGTLARVYVVVA